MQFWAPDDGRKTRLKHEERLTEINKLWNVESCWLYSANAKTSQTAEQKRMSPYLNNVQGKKQGNEEDRSEYSITIISSIKQGWHKN